MRTPAGKECPHYYEDYYRGREVQECRLVKDNPESLNWKPTDCSRCPIPDIVNANASKDMVLSLIIKPGVLGFGRRLEATAFCIKHQIDIDDPYVGCLQCNAERPGLDIFRQALEDPSDD